MAVTKILIPIFENLKQTRVHDHVTIEQVMDTVRSGGYLKTVIKAIRSTTDKDKQNRLKADLPLFMPSVHVSDYRKLDSNADYYSTGLVQFDIDHLSVEESNSLKKKVVALPEVIYAFLSPRNGLKFGVLTDFLEVSGNNLKRDFGHAFDLTADYIQTQINGIKIDTSTHSIAQGCYFSHDPDCYFNPDAERFICRDEAIRNRVAVDIKKNSFIPSTIRCPDGQVLEALSHIPHGFGYDERLKINFAVIDALGDGAMPVLRQHWRHENQDKLVRDINTQIESSKNKTRSDRITVLTLFKIAKEHGWKPKPNTNIKAQATDLPPTFNSNLLSITEAKEILKTSIEDFFIGKKSKIINFEAGGGKTECVIDAICDRLIVNRFQKIALCVPNHKLAQQIEASIKKTLNQKITTSETFREKMTARRALTVQHINGRNSENCQHPLEQSKSDEKLSEDKQALINIFNAHTASFCFSCSKRSNCQYIDQFNNIWTNIRIYTHQELFNKTGLWNNGQDADGQPSKDKWIPDFIIVDEDIVGTAIDKSVTQTKYANCDNSQTGKLLKDLIHGNAGQSLEQFIQNHASDLADIYEQQNKNLDDWKKDYPKPRIRRNGSQETVSAFARRERKKPDTYPIIDHLHDYSLILSKVDNPDELENDVLYVEGAAIKFAGRKSIKPEFSDVPILLLDATAIESIANAVFNHDFDFENISIGLQDNVTVYQFENKIFSKKQLTEPEEPKKIRAFINKHSDGKSFGIITYLNLPSGNKFDEELATSLNADAYGHFGNIRGLNNFQDLDQLYIVGRQMISSYDLELNYRQIFGGVRKRTKFPLFEKHVSEEVFRMSTGQNMAIPQQTYTNARVQAVDHFINRSETYQAAHRLRLIHGEQPKEVFLMTNQVLDITVDKLLNSHNAIGRSKPKRDEKIMQVVNVIKAVGILWDKNNKIVQATSLSQDDVKNLRSSGDFVKDVLSKEPSICHETIYGKDKNYGKVSKDVFRLRDFKVDTDSLKSLLDLRQVLNIQQND